MLISKNEMLIFFILIINVEIAVASSILSAKNIKSFNNILFFFDWEKIYAENWNKSVE